MFTTIALAAANGSYLMAESGDSWDVCAIPNEIGAWETFRLFNRTRPGEEPRHGDSVVLQAWHGRFISAAGGGGGILNAALRWIEASTTFTIERVAGAGAIRSGEQVALRAANGNYVVAEGGGGGEVNANRPVRGPWETFTIKIFRPQLVRLRASNNRYVTAENGGGAQVTANREGVGLWETFSLHNLSRPERAVRNGDTIALQVWNGKFIQVGGALPTEVNANANRASQAAQFTIRAAGVDEIGPGQRVNLRSRATSKYLAPRNGRLVAGSSSATANTFFAIDFAEQAGIDFEWVPDGASLPGRPFERFPDPVSGEKSLLVLYYHNNVAPRITATPDQVRDAIFGPAPSLASWVQSMSGGALRVENAGVYGSIRIPDATDEAPDPGMSAILTAAEDAGVPLASFAPGGVFDTNRVQLVEVSAFAVGGQAGRWRTGTSHRGIRFSGSVPWVGVSPDVNEGSRMVLCHEISHQLMNVNDRYGVRRLFRGDVIANRTWVGDWERFVVEPVAGAGPVHSGDQVMLRAHDGKHLSVSSSPPDLAPGLINTESAGAGLARVFTLAKASGTGEISSGMQVTLCSSAGRFMTAEMGGNSIMTANREVVGEWERFEINKLGGTGPLISGDTVSLKSSEGYYVVAESGARDRPRDPITDENDRRRGYLWVGGSGEGGGFDNASANYSAVMLSLWDRVRLGWVRPRYLTPDNRGCYLLRPFLDSRDALILFDPQNPGEWYTVENRQRRENLDEIPSSGVVISWVCQDEGYWRWWFEAANDVNWELYHTRYPAVISAAAAGVPPNSMARPVGFDPDALTRRNHPNAAFTDQEIVLPLGNGDPSRFHLSFHPMAGERIAMCLR
jgi:hypothetical protein